MRHGTQGMEVSVSFVDRSVRVLAAADDPASSLDVLFDGLAQGRGHVVALELWCRPDRLGSTEAALRQQRDKRPWVPPWRAGEGPGSRVAPFVSRDALYERVRTLTTVDDLGLVLVVDPAPSEAREASLVAAAMLARPQDAVATCGTQLELLPWPRLRVVSPVVDRELRDTPWTELCRRTALPPAHELSGVLRRHARGWTYTVRHGVREVAAVSLSEVLGSALAAVILAPDGDPYLLHDVATGPEVGWGRSADAAPEGVEARVRTWMSRLRKALAHWSRSGLDDFVPTLRSRRLSRPVDIEFDAGLPWARTWPGLPTSSPTSTTGPTSRPGWPIGGARIRPIRS